MKLNNFFVMGATAFAMTSGSVYAADDAAIANVIWSGDIGSSIPSSNLIITGLGGGDIETGKLYVDSKGTFSSSEVVLESRQFDPETATVGDRQPGATWTYVTSQLLLDGQVSDQAEIKVYDDGLELQKATPTVIDISYVKLAVKNDIEITDIPVQGNATVSVQMAASYVEQL
ncbi:hypothetical protein [Vibrio pomeroyi]|uniref:hypothetical protein n=1 Tax=Vibrio pomeroyi TaxID=198832 RepID=UPI0021C43C6E|nr:hypothetical protein [Vibrio pomeroyi]